MIYHFEDYTLDEERHELCRAGKAVSIEPRVFQVLLYLIEHRDRVVSKAERFEQCWPDTFVTESALTRCMTKLRRAVRTPPGATDVIKTVHRQGYRWVADVRVMPPENLSPDPPLAARLAQPLTQPVETVPPAVVTDTQPAPPPVPPEPSGVALATPDRVVPGVEALAVTEQRQLTVLSCALIGAAQLAAQLDPEDLHDVLHTFHTTCAEIVAPFEGQIAQRASTMVCWCISATRRRMKTMPSAPSEVAWR